MDKIEIKIPFYIRLFGLSDLNFLITKGYQPCYITKLTSSEENFDIYSLINSCDAEKTYKVTRVRNKLILTQFTILDYFFDGNNCKLSNLELLYLAHILYTKSFSNLNQLETSKRLSFPYLHLLIQNLMRLNLEDQYLMVYNILFKVGVINNDIYTNIIEYFKLTNIEELNNLSLVFSSTNFKLGRKLTNLKLFKVCVLNEKILVRSISEKNDLELILKNLGLFHIDMDGTIIPITNQIKKYFENLCSNISVMYP